MSHTSFFIELYKKEIPDFNMEQFTNWETYAARDYDTLLFENKLENVKVLEVSEDVDSWVRILIFQVQGKDEIYSVECREGSYASGVNFYYNTLKEVQAHKKIVTVYY